MDERPLPPAWRKAKDSEGKDYYFNENTGETTWDFPGDGPKPAVAATAVVEPEEEAPARMDVPSSMVDPGMPDFGVSSRAAPSGGAGSLDMPLGDGGLPRVVIVIFCSLVVLIASSIASGRSIGNGAAESYGIAVGSISLAAGLGYVALAKKKPATFSNWSLPKVKGDLSVTQCYALFLVAWWTPAAAVLTFFSPFLRTSNGYFATWAAFATSILSLGAAFSRVQVAFKTMSTLRGGSDYNVKALVGLACASAVVFFASIEFTDKGEGVFGLITGILSFLIALMLLLGQKKVGPAVKKGVSALLMVWWLAAAIVLTFDQPFGDTGNGYFGTLVATFCAVGFAYQQIIGGEMPFAAGVRRSFSFAPMDDEMGPAPPATTAHIGNASNVA